MIIEYANEADYSFLVENDIHIPKEMIKTKIQLKEYIIAKDESSQIVGWLRYNYFWDSSPFMNLLYINEGYRRKGFGKNLVHFWEETMKSKGYDFIMTSTLSNEEAQHFYRKLGYNDTGSLLLPNEPLEILFTKKI